MSMHVTSEVHDHLIGLLDTIREAVLHLIHTDSPNLRGLMADALAAAEADLPDDTGLRVASNAIRALLGGPLPEVTSAPENGSALKDALALPKRLFDRLMDRM